MVQKRKKMASEVVPEMKKPGERNMTAPEEYI